MNTSQNQDAIKRGNRIFEKCLQNSRKSHPLGNGSWSMDGDFYIWGTNSRSHYSCSLESAL